METKKRLVSLKPSEERAQEQEHAPRSALPRARLRTVPGFGNTEVASDFDEIHFRKVVYENPIGVGWRGEGKRKWTQ